SLAVQPEPPCPNLIPSEPPLLIRPPCHWCNLSDRLFLLLQPGRNPAQPFFWAARLEL
ncbi:hypothetical protein COCCADRAFT_112630, partial [Bipolaris zeicola 26-R-13]